MSFEQNNCFSPQKAFFSWRVVFVATLLALVPVVFFLFWYFFSPGAECSSLSTLGLLTVIVFILLPMAIPIAGFLGFLSAALVTLLNIRRETGSFCNPNSFGRPNFAMKTFAIHMTLILSHFALWMHAVPYVLAHRPIVAGLRGEIANFLMKIYWGGCLRFQLVIPLGFLLFFFVEYRFFRLLYQRWPKLANTFSLAATSLLIISLLILMVCILYLIL